MGDVDEGDVDEEVSAPDIEAMTYIDKSVFTLPVRARCPQRDVTPGTRRRDVTSGRDLEA